MELNKLYYFYIVAKHEHVTRAAEELCVSQPALTKTIKLLEDEIGVPLFRKEKRNIRLTDFGKFLKEKLDSVFQIIDEINIEVNTLKGLYENTIRLNVLAATSIVTEAIVEFKKNNENVIFQVIQNEEESDCDITITTSCDKGEKPENVKKISVIPEEIYLAVPKIYKHRQEIDLKELKAEGFVNLAGSRLFRNICDKFCEEAGFKPKNIFESDSIVAVKNIIGAGAGIGFWPAFSWGDSTEDIHLLKIENIECKRNIIILLHKNNRQSKLCEEFYEFLSKFVSKQSEGN